MFEIIMLAYLPIGTFFLNKWRKRIYSSNGERRGLYLLVSSAMAALPFIYVSSIQVEASALGVVLVGIGLFWFAIVGSRSSAT
ncbi:hypothetical protein [Shewanella sediminis]|uniref:hypothetical protein n=1 Tax=Shewanella sediminis TaxID=271097 RepID=UPI00059BFDD1|nr:hypothetical protein [Shewanella sediminis]